MATTECAMRSLDACRLILKSVQKNRDNLPIDVQNEIEKWENETGSLLSGLIGTFSQHNAQQKRQLILIPKKYR